MSRVDYQNDRYHTLASIGKCVHCGKNRPTEGRKRCPRCLKIVNSAVRRWRKRGWMSLSYYRELGR